MIFVPRISLYVYKFLSITNIISLFYFACFAVLLISVVN